MHPFQLLPKLTDRIRRKGLFDTVEAAWNNGGGLLKHYIYLRDIMPNLLNDKLKSLLHTNILELRNATLHYISSNNKLDNSFGAYSFKPGGPPLIYASCYAALTRHLYGDLNFLSSSETLAGGVDCLSAEISKR